MEKIEFRAWHKKYKYMARVAGINFNKKRINLNGADIGSFEDIELMQWTGLRDNTRTEEYPKGKKIFVGDIVQINNDYDIYGKNAGEKYEVYFNAGGFRLKPKYDVHKRGDRGFWLDDGNDVVVLGNIYENKELLNE